jgi:hypothetical protein
MKRIKRFLNRREQQWSPDDDQLPYGQSSRGPAQNVGNSAIYNTSRSITDEPVEPSTVVVDEGSPVSPPISNERVKIWSQPTQRDVNLRPIQTDRSSTSSSQLEASVTLGLVRSPTDPLTGQQQFTDPVFHPPNEPRAHSPLRNVIEQDGADEDHGPRSRSPSPNPSERSSILGGAPHPAQMYTDPGLPRPPSISSSAIDNEDRWPEIIRLEIDCELELRLDDGKPYLLPEKIPIKWYEEATWKKLEDKAWEWLGNQEWVCGHTLQRNGDCQHLKIHHGSFRIIGTKHQSRPRKLQERNMSPRSSSFPFVASSTIILWSPLCCG